MTRLARPRRPEADRGERYAAVRRAFAVLRLITAAPQTYAELATALDVSELTIRRTIESVRAADVPITARRRHNDPRGPLEFRAAPI